MHRTSGLTCSLIELWAYWLLLVTTTKFLFWKIPLPTPPPCRHRGGRNGGRGGRGGGRGGHGFHPYHQPGPAEQYGAAPAPLFGYAPSPLAGLFPPPQQQQQSFRGKGGGKGKRGGQ